MVKQEFPKLEINYIKKIVLNNNKCLILKEDSKKLYNTYLLI